jgi:hypothetical protein
VRGQLARRDLLQIWEPKRKMDKYLAHYVVSHYFSLLTPNEHSKLISDDPEVRSLASEGMEAFEQLTATRILQEHRSEIFLNYCPECGGLARTPKSRQCPVCLYDWHDA